MSADFSTVTNLGLITADNVLKNPLPFLFLFTLYFLMGMGIILGSKLDASSKEIQSDRVANMLQFDSYRQIVKEVPLWARLIRSIFLVANIFLALLAIAAGVCGISTFGSTFHWIFGNHGNFALIAYACSQFIMFLVGLYQIGIIPGKGSHHLSFGLWLVLGISIFLLHVFWLNLAQNNAVRVPKLFCPGDSAGVDGMCVHSWRTVLLPFWNSTTPEDRQKVFDEHLQGLNCTSLTTSGTHVSHPLEMSCVDLHFHCCC
jgi:hypothetical protein